MFDTNTQTHPTQATHPPGDKTKSAEVLTQPGGQHRYAPSVTPDPRLARRERSELCDLFERMGPDAPTLCAGWSTRDLAAHLVVREGRPDAAVGIVIKRLAGWGKRVQDGAARRDWPELIAIIRNGPPIWSGFALPGIDAMMNTAEFFVHHEDVRRASEQWQPRELREPDAEALWKIVRARSSMFFRHANTGVILRRTDGGGGQQVAHPGRLQVTLSGPAQELALYAFGRKDHALVKVTGDAEAIANFTETDLSI